MMSAPTEGRGVSQLSVPVIAVAVDAASVERPVIDAWAREQDPPVAAVLDAVSGPVTGSAPRWRRTTRRSSCPSGWRGCPRSSGAAAPPGSPSSPCSRPRSGRPPGCPGRLTALSPNRRRVLAGEPALLSDLRKRYLDTSGAPAPSTGDEADPEAFAAFVRRSAVVTLEREERAEIGNRYKVPHAVSEEILARKEFRDEIADGLGRDGPDPRRGPREGRGVPRRAGRRAEPRGRRHVLRDDGAAALLDLAGARRRVGTGQAARAQQALRAGLPAGPPLLRRHAGARRRARPQRLPAQPRDGRRQPPHLADQRPGPPGGHRVHPPQLRRRRDLQGGGPGVLRVPAGQALQPGVVLRGRALAHRQDPQPPLRPAPLRRPGGAERPGRGRLPGADVDHLRPAARGLQDGRRAGRREEAGRGPEVARRVRPLPAPHARRLGVRAVRRADRRSARGCPGRARPPTTTARRCTRSPSRSRSASTARRR